MKLAGSLGMRREEICGLKWENVDLRRHLVLIREARTAYGANIVQKETKNRASVRTLYLPDEVYLILERERARQQQERCLQSPAYNPTDHVILDAKGAPYSPNALSLAFTRFVRKNDLPRLTFHGLRHTFATIASCQGPPCSTSAKRWGTPPRHHRTHLHPPGGPDPRGAGTAGVRRSEMRGSGPGIRRPRSGIRWFEGNGLCHGVPQKGTVPCSIISSCAVP